MNALICAIQVEIQLKLVMNVVSLVKMLVKMLGHLVKMFVEMMVKMLFQSSLLLKMVVQGGALGLDVKMFGLKLVMNGSAAAALALG